MTLPLPSLDDRRWEDLVEEGRALLPFYAPDWTDHNVSDPGIMLMELLAWLAEMDIFRVDQVPEAHRRKFLALIGIRAEPPKAAQTVLALRLDAAFLEAELALPTGLELEANDPFGLPTRFRTLAPLTVLRASLRAIHCQVGPQRIDVTARHGRGEPFPALGDDPAPGNALILSFGTDPADEPLPTGVPIRLWLALQPQVAAGEDERHRIVQEVAGQAAACERDEGCAGTGWSGAAPPSVWSCGRTLYASPPVSGLAQSSSHPSGATAILAHHAARTVWEVEVGPDLWRRLDPGAGELRDETRALTLSGAVTVTLPPALARLSRRDPVHALRRLRCRLVRGSLDAAPLLHSIALNAVLAEQAAVPAGAEMAGAGGDWMERVGTGDGWPEQRIRLPEAPVLAEGFRLVTEEAGVCHDWAVREDFDASGRADRHVVLDAAAGELRFGDGEHGAVLPEGAEVCAHYLTTRAGEGNLAAGQSFGLVDGPANRALLGGAFPARLQQFAPATGPGAWVTNPLPATGGTRAELLTLAEARALAGVTSASRAVTLSDYEALALATPGTRVVRAKAFANRHPTFPCLLAPGIVSVAILPSLPLGRPQPSAELCQAVAGYLNRRHVLGTRLEVVGPTYTAVSVRATVRGHAGVSPAALRRRVEEALGAVFHPLTGGPDGQGWPFGRDVYRSEVLQVIVETPGVDHVLALSLSADGGEPQCANLCLGAFGLVAPAPHQIEVLG